MTVPQIMSRIWDGDPNERFTDTDMRRVEYNANLVAKYAGVPQVPFLDTRRDSQFRYDEAQKLEDLTEAIGTKIGFTVPVEHHWSAGRSVSYADFERWESGLWMCYEALGGIGERIPAETKMHTVRSMLYASEWAGGGPWYQDIDVPLLVESGDAMVYVSADATAEARAAEFNALLQAKPLDSDTIRIWAYGLKPAVTIPLKISTKEFTMFKQIILRGNAWQGTGPWTQVFDLGTRVENAVVGPDERNNAGQQRQMADAVIGVSAVAGTRVTVRAIGVRPTADLNATVAYSSGSVA